MKKKSWGIKPIISVLLSLFLVLTSIDVTSYAKETESGQRTLLTEEDGQAEESNTEGDSSEEEENSSEEESEEGGSSGEKPGEEDGFSGEEPSGEDDPAKEESEEDGSFEEEDSSDEEQSEEEEESPDEDTKEKEDTKDKPAKEETDEQVEEEEEEEQEGAIIISAFQSLPESVSHIILKEKGTLADVTALMPDALQAYTDVTDADTEEVSREEIEVEVQWECTEDYESTQFDTYTFKPVWDEQLYTWNDGGETEEESEADVETEGEPESGEEDHSEEEPESEAEGESEAGGESETKDSSEENPETDTTASEETAGIPVITVSIENSEENKEPSEEEKDGVVTTEEELSKALESGEEEIVLGADISLTDTLFVPGEAEIVLDGQGYSLFRSQGEEGTFNGIMLQIGSQDDTEENSGSLTLSNVRIDGSTPGDRTGAPAVVDYSNLVMEEGAVIINNYNYGTYGETIIQDFGGGIQVFGQLSLKEDSAITGNFADELGGGVYLAEGAALYLYADVINGNSVGESDGFGADLYASNNSTIYYDPSIDMERDSFYICRNTILISMGGLPTSQIALKASKLKPAKAKAGNAADNIEIYLNLPDDSGYDLEELKSRLEKELRDKGWPVTILIPTRKDIDTTDLRNWYVYDHYDTCAECWEPTDDNGNGIPDTWEEAYREYRHRAYYPFTETFAWGVRAGYGVVENKAYTIADWLASDEYKMLENTITYKTLAQFQEHIYTRSENGKPEMTFAGYGTDPKVDFLFYNPESSGKKVVEFDVNSAMVNTHTLAGTGFLVNTELSGDGKLNGYLIYYTYSGTSATSVRLYQLNNVDAAALHDGRLGIGGAGFSLATAATSITNWQNEMSIKIVAEPEKIEITQVPKAGGEEQKIVWTIADNGYSSFGPLVAYVSHACPKASSFTYSNLHMYYVDGAAAGADLLKALQGADYTQDAEKYFLNLLGDSEADYDGSATMGLYQEYLALLQDEGIALITDKDTPFEDYLGDNLCELERDNADTKLTIEQLIEQIANYLEEKAGDENGTTWDEDENRPAEPHHSIGNIWLKEGDSQIGRAPLDGWQSHTIEIMDRAVRVDANTTASYMIQKPESEIFESIALDGMTFRAGGDEVVWPEGEYAVQQEMTDIIEGTSQVSSIRGYAYFSLEYPDAPVEPVPTQRPAKPKQPTPPATPEEPPVEETVYEEAQETEVIQVQTVKVEDKAQPPAEEESVPKTGENKIPPMPVALGACTVFMLKILLWMYEIELGITEEKKNEMIQALTAWARGTSKPRIYVAVIAIAIVLAGYHLLKAISDKSRKMVKERLGR